MPADPLNLRSLPLEAPPADLWPAIAASLDARPSAARASRRGYARFALAASVVALAVGIALLRPAPQPAAVDPALQLARLQDVSAALELRLDGYRDGVLSAASADVIARLERELAWLDLQLDDAPRDTALWAERVVLLGEITERYLRSDWRSDLMLASY